MFLRLFEDYIWSFNVMRVISQAHFGGGQLSEIYETARRIEEPDRESWHREWCATAERVEVLAREADADGKEVSARQAYERATQYWRMAGFFLAPGDGRCVPTFLRSVECFAEAGKRFDPPLERVHLPYLDTTLPGYFFRGRGQEPGERRPTVVFCDVIACLDG